MNRFFTCLIVLLATFSLSWATLSADSLKIECWDHAQACFAAYKIFLNTQDQVSLVSGIAEAAKADLLLEMLENNFKDSLSYKENIDNARKGLSSLYSTVASKYVTETITDPKNQLAPYAVFLTLVEIDVKKVLGIKSEKRF